MGVDQSDLGLGLSLDRAERSMRAVLRELPDGVHTFADQLDDDGLGSGPLEIRLRLEVKGETATADFAGTAPASEGGVNALPAIVHSAVSYAFRCLLPAGNVETSQRLVAPGARVCFSP